MRSRVLESVCVNVALYGGAVVHCSQIQVESIPVLFLTTNGAGRGSLVEKGARGKVVKVGQVYK